MRSALIELALTPSEADAYLTLVHAQPMTAYAVAKAAQMDKANTYKALESLSTKGAVEVADGERRIWAAVEPTEFLSVLRERHGRAIERATGAASRRSPTVRDRRVYEIKSVDAVYQRATEMLDRSVRTVAVDGFPGPLERVAPALERTSARGVTVSVRRYGSPEISGAHVFDAENHGDILTRWSGAWLTIAVDALEVLIAYVARDDEDVYQCAYTASPVVAMVIQNGVIGETLLGEVQRRRRAGEDADSSLDDVLGAAEIVDPLDLPGRMELGGVVPE